MEILDQSRPVHVISRQESVKDLNQRLEVDQQFTVKKQLRLLRMLSSDGYPKSVDEIMSDLKRDFEGVEDEFIGHQHGLVQM